MSDTVKQEIIDTRAELSTLKEFQDSIPKLGRWRSVVSPATVKKSNLSHWLWQHSFLPFREGHDNIRTTRGLLGKDLLILKHGQRRRNTSELEHLHLTSTPRRREDFEPRQIYHASASSTRRVFRAKMNRNRFSSYE
ncbi:hypothetical protein TNCV_552701 [Trichonephila clavipes]|nr:hypothetical protein TNCV_552701 [Trichonephila clavipes]